MKKTTQLGAWTWIDFDELESTNDEALRTKLEYADKKLVISAKKQTKGRGRRGRSWIGQDGNLFMSLLLNWPTADTGALVLIVGLALLKTVKKMSGSADVKLKWPNDVLLNGKKMSGILLESGHTGTMIIGIGVNIAAYPDDDTLIYKATSLLEAGIKCNRAEFLQEYLKQFDEISSLLITQRMMYIVEEWQKNAKGIGQAIIVHMPKKEERGIFRGLDSQGMLLLENAEGQIKTISAGDVFFEKEE